jgi:hypothetical protein
MHAASDDNTTDYIGLKEKNRLKGKITKSYHGWQEETASSHPLFNTLNPKRGEYLHR